MEAAAAAATVAALCGGIVYCMLETEAKATIETAAATAEATVPMVLVTDIALLLN